MTPTFKKLNFKNQSEIIALNAPTSFEEELCKLDGVSITRVLDRKINFVIAFVTTQAMVDATSRTLAAKSTGDVIFWLAYPKMTSKKYF